MTFMDTLKLALSNLGQAKLRTALTVLGVSIGIASLAGMLSLGVGLEDQVMGRFQASGMFDSITVTSVPIFRAGRGRLGRGANATGTARGDAPGGRGADAAGPGTAGSLEATIDSSRARLDDDVLAKIAALPNVKSVYPNLRVPLQVTFRDFSEVSGAAGVPMSSRGEGAFQTLTAGKFFANETDDACMLSLDMAKRMTPDDPATLIGQAITLTYMTAPGRSGAPAAAAPGVNPALQIQRIDLLCPVIGIVERETAPGLGGGAVSPLMIPLAKARTMDAELVTNAQSLLRQGGEPRGYGSISVRVDGARHTQDIEAQIKTMGLSAFSLNDILQGAKRAFIIVDILLSIIGSIALAVSSLGIVNTMIMSILERTREIGIMKAIGGSDGDIRRIFLIEASTIGLIGGVTGIALGWAVGRVINFGANIYIKSQGGSTGDLFSMPLWLIASAIGFSIFVSLIAGSFPARRAARLDPIQALRHD